MDELMPDRANLTRVLQAVGLPPPVRIGPVGHGWRHRLWRIGFPEGTAPDVLVRVPSHPELGDTIAPEIAALTLLQGTDLPVVRRYRRIELETGSASVSDVLPGLTGAQVMAVAPMHAPVVVRAVGEVMRRLAAMRQPAFGTRAVGNRFVPERATWAESWQARVERARALAAVGGDLGGLSRAIDAAIEARLPALQMVLDFALVHGDLQPGNLLFTEGEGGVPVLSGVIDFERAIAGDPLVDWGPSMLVPDGTLAEVLAGYGREEVRMALAEPGATERIELYWLTQLLEWLAEAAGPHLRGDAAGRGRARAQVALFWERFASGPGAAARIEAALGGGGPVAHYDQPGPVAILRHGLADALARGRVATPEQAWTWVGAARAVALAERAPLGRDGWLGAAIQLLERLGDGDRVPGEAISDRTAFRQGLVGRVLGAHQLADGGPGTPLALLAEAVGLDLALGGALSDDAWRGLQSAVFGLCALGVGWRRGAEVSPSVQLAHGVMGLAAVRVLEPLASDPGLASAVGRGFSEQVGDAWSGLGADPTGGELLDLLDRGPVAVREGDEPALTPAICGALLDLDEGGALPVAGSAIARVLGLDPAG